MSKRLKVVTRRQGRRLAVRQQRLAGPRPEPTKPGLARLVRELGCLQIDPIRVVERSPLLVLWSRVGSFAPGLLDELLYQDRALFEGWAHAASIVHRDHLPIHRWRMERFASGDTVGAERVRSWLEANRNARREILTQLGGEPVRPDELEATPVEHWRSTGWTESRNLRMLLDLMWRKGEVMVGGRDELRKLYVDAAEWFEWEPMPLIDEEDAVRRAVLIALHALGVATSRQINKHFTRGGYPGLAETLARLVEEGEVQPVSVIDEAGHELKGPWYLPAELAGLAARLDEEPDPPRTTLLSPFDNLIADRERTSLLWDFDYRAEIYVPKAKRVYGHYVMPILHGSELVGRVDPKVDREVGVLRIKAIHFEPGWKRRPPIEAGLRRAAESLAVFLGLERVAWPAGFGQ